MDIVSWTFSQAKYDQEKPLYIDSSDSSRSLSAKDTRTLVRKLISGFQHHGLGKGDTVCVLSFNDYHYTSLYLSIIGSGACFTGANPGYTARELIHHLRITNAKFLLTELKTLQIAIEAAKACSIPELKIFVLNYKDESTGDYQSWQELQKHGEKDWIAVMDPANTPAAYVSTSGTSGLPKAAIITHSYLVSQGEFQERLAARQRISSLIAIPPFHVFTMPVQHAFPLRTGSATYIMPRFEERGFVNALEEFKITQTVVVPPILMSLSKQPDFKLKYLRKIFVGGSCATDGMQKQLYEKLSRKARIIQVYGMTEVGWATTWTKKEKDGSGSVGQPLPETKLRVVDSSNSPILTPYTTGEIQIFTPHAMKGYLSNALSTSQAFTFDQWVRTGDIGYQANGNWYVIDRTKDLIKVRGWQVSPAEIEAVLLEHEDVLDAGVIGVPSPDGCGESPVAYIKLTPSASVSGCVSEMDIKSFLSDRLARYKNVDSVSFVDSIPRNPTGKILRRILREEREVDIKKTGDQVAAEEYKVALLKLDKWQQMRRSLEGKKSPAADLEFGVVNVKIEDEERDLKGSAISVVEIKNESGGESEGKSGIVVKKEVKQLKEMKKKRKREYCPADPFVYLRKLRCR